MADPDAAAILQDYLDAVAKTVMEDDWPSYRDAVSLPCHVISHDESKVVSTEADLRAGFEQFRDTLRFHQVTDYIRLVESASLLDHDLISGSYISHLLARSYRILSPFRSQMTLRLQGSRWRAVSVTNGLANSRWPLIRLQLSPNSEEGPLQ
jgi:hypothetical protein